MVLHSFGRNLKWNPHIHCLISEGGCRDNGFWLYVHHFNYTFLRNAFRTALLNEWELRIGSSFKKVKARCYRDHKEGFYVYAKPNNCDPDTVIKYIGRCLGRPVIAASGIDKYDGGFVTFHYNRHEDNKYVEETIPAPEFIRRRTAILSAFGYDPLECEYAATMLFLELCFNHKRVPLEEMYENVMSRSHGWRSSA